jgi:hypothetical protein
VDAREKKTISAIVINAFRLMVIPPFEKLTAISPAGSKNSITSFPR